MSYHLLWPGWPPILRFPFFFFLLDLGFVMSSEEGGLLELDEFFDSLAILANMKLPAASEGSI